MTSYSGQRAAAFTLIELMIVVAIIAIVAAVAIPIISTARMSANESAAIGAIKAVVSAQEGYRLRNGGYGIDWEDLVDDGWLDETFATEDIFVFRQGYRLRLVATRYRFWVFANPVTPGQDGVRSFGFNNGLATALPSGTLLFLDPSTTNVWTPLR